jgi:hypothetical protein
MVAMEGEVPFPDNTQVLPSPSPAQPRLVPSNGSKDAVKFRAESKSVISKPRIKLETFGICISFGSGKDEFEATAYFVIHFPGES